MVYIYDVLLNWSDTDKIYEFFEWNNNDVIEHIKKIPLLKIGSNQMNDIVKHVIKIDKNLLNNLCNKCEIFYKRDTEVINYACLFTDGKKVIAIEFDEEGKSCYHSSLLLDEEMEILDISERIDCQVLKYQILRSYHVDAFFTRQEESRKRYLLKELKATYQNKNYQKLNYLYAEYFDDELDDIDVIYKKFLESLKSDFNEKHQHIYQLLKLSHTKKQV